MSKKKGKQAAKTAAKKTSVRRSAAKKSPGKSRSSARPSARLAAGPAGTTSQVTIYLFRTGHGNKIRTAPQLAFAGPGHVEWTVVNLIDGTDVPVTITWPDGGPWGKEPIDIKSMVRLNCDDVAPGRYKYVVSAFDAREDPELEFPMN